MKYPFEEISPFVASPDDLQEQLSGNILSDVVVIGGGYTGLSTALNLREAGIDVVLLEKDFCGAGTSGSNAGHLTPTIGKDLPSLVMFFGKERAGNLVRFADKAVTYTEALIKRFEIDCEYMDTGNIIAGVHPKHEKPMRKAIEVAKAVGAEQRFLENGDLRERGFPAAFGFGIHERKGGTLNPGRYVSGLRSAAIAAGVRIFENSPALRVDEGAEITVHAPNGTVKADKLVLATNAYTGNTAPVIKGLRRKSVPLSVSLFETEPLSQDHFQAIGWGGREGIYTSHEMLESYRVTSRNTIVGGAKFVRYRWNMQLAPNYDAHAFGIITQGFRDRFPEVTDLGIRHYWSGRIGFALDFLPTCGCTGKHDNIYYGLAYAGHGMAQASYMGEILARMIAGESHPAQEVLKRRVLPNPPEPFLWFIAWILVAFLRWLDKRTDREITDQSLLESESRH